VPYLSANLGKSEHAEVLGDALSKERALLYRTLEWDADSTAALSSLRIWRDIYGALGLASHLAPVGRDRAWLIAMSMLFWIIDLVQPKDRDRACAVHPSPLTRLICVELVCEHSAGMRALTQQKEEHDSLIPWIVRNGFSRQILERRLPSPDAVTREWMSFVKQYVQIADRLEEHQEARSKSTGRPIMRQLSRPALGRVRNSCRGCTYCP
jgi:hypothetical protein